MNARFICFFIFLFLPQAHGQPTGPGPVTGAHGMVVSADSLASAAGIEVLKSGGNAIDAAVAIGFALAVTYPEAGNLGGGGYMLIRTADGQSVVVDFRETAPAAVSSSSFLDGSGNPIPGASLHGCLSSGVPGTVAGFLHALRRFGTKSRSEILRPAIRLAQNGIRVNKHLAGVLRGAMQEFRDHESTLAVFSRNGLPYEEGDTVQQPDLAGTLNMIAAKGREGFYTGEVARRLIGEMRRGGGLITKSDLRSYRALERSPVTGRYRGYDIVSAGPSSSGGIVLIEILNMLERFDLTRAGQNSANAIHVFASAAQRAYADRAEYLGDPDFVSIPLRALLSKEYAGRRVLGIDTVRRTPSATIRAGLQDSERTHQTTHFCVVDDKGNAVSVTVTLNELFGNAIVVSGAGFFLNNEMDDFVIKPGVANLFGLSGGSANVVGPRKRMLSTMTPTIILKDGHPVLLVGARGGSRIATAVAQVITNLLDFGMAPLDAVTAPRVHHQWMPDVLYYESGIRPGVIGDLKSRGFTCELAAGTIAQVEAIFVDQESHWFVGGPDPREGGVAIGY